MTLYFLLPELLIYKFSRFPQHIDRNNPIFVPPIQQCLNTHKQNHRRGMIPIRLLIPESQMRVQIVQLGATHDCPDHSTQYPRKHKPNAPSFPISGS